MLRKFVVAITTKASSTTTNVLFSTIKDLSKITKASSTIIESSSFIAFIFLVAIKTTSSLTKAKLISIDIEITINKSLSSLYTSIDFYLINNLIYHIKSNKTQLCISRNTKSTMIKTTHNDYFHANHYRVYVKLNDIIYIYKLFRKLIIYIRHCS